MNDQQSPSASDPQQQPPSVSDGPTCSGDTLSDQEAFALLAESMALGDAPQAGPSGAITPGRPAEDEPESSADENVDDSMPPVVTFGAGASFLTRIPNSGGRTTGPVDDQTNRRRFDWSTPILVDEQWEVVDGDGGNVHGQITEVIDLNQVPPMVIRSDGDGTALSAIDSANRILPPMEEYSDDRPLPPLVFLDTRGDIVPGLGDSPNGGNGDRFEGVVAGWGGPSDETTSSACGVDNMAESRTDLEGMARLGPSTATDRQAAPVADEGERPPSTDGPNGTGVIEHAHVPDPPPSTDPTSAADHGHSVAAYAAAPTPPGAVSSSAADDEADILLEELQRVFDQYSGPVIAVIASIAQERRAIDEALQSTFEAVWKAIDTFDPDQPRGPWMFTLARRQAAEQVELARRVEQESTPGRYPVPSHRQDEAIAVDKSWEAWEVRLAVDQLSPAEHDVLRLIHSESLIHPEIAAKLQTTVGAVKSHAYSGSHRLVELLDHVIRPEATDDLTVDQASALTWYLAGVADGSGLDAEERSAIKRVQGQLASATAWIQPDSHAGERIASFARRTLDDPGPLAGASTGQHAVISADDTIMGAATGPARTADRPGERAGVAPSANRGSRRWLLGVVVVAGLLALAAAFAFLTGSSDTGSETLRRYQMQASGVDEDATGVVEITAVNTGTRYAFEFGGLDSTSDDQFYAAWLQSTAGGGVVPLGSFSWQAAGDPLVLSGPTWSDAYDLLVVTRSGAMTEASIEDLTILSASIE